MNLFGLEIRNVPAITRLNIRSERLQVRAGPLTPVSSNRGGWNPFIREPFAGAWQRNMEIKPETVLAHHAVYSCITRIAQDIGKLRPKLVEQDDDGIWTETTSAAFSGVLNQPNRFQNYIQFQEWWMTSKLVHGNAYALIERDGRGIAQALYLLDPRRVVVLVAPDGEVFYQLKMDNLAGLQIDEIAVPASEIVHDRMNCLFHPLVGVSPIYACGTAANMGLEIERNSSSFFGNGSNPSGILTRTQEISPDKSRELSLIWNAQFGGNGSGGVAVLGGDMKYTPMRMSAVDSQLVEQLKWTAETVCSTFHVPPFKVGVGTAPTYQNAEIMNQVYYSDCLQSFIEAFELCMDQALGLRTPTNTGRTMGVELDLDGLLRMDTESQIRTLKDAVGGSIFSVNDARKKLDLPPKPGGDSIWMQQQNYSLEALQKRDEGDPFAVTAPERITAQGPAATDPQTPVPEKQLTAGTSRDALKVLATRRARNLRIRNLAA